MKNYSWSLTIRVIVISLLIGGSSGVLATALTTSYLSQYAFELSKLTEPLRLTTEQPRTVPQGYEDALETLQTQALDAVGSLFPSNIPLTGFTQADQLSSVVVLTSDGWMLSGDGVLGSVVEVGNQTCIVEEVHPVPLTGMVFIHCDVNNFSVVDLGEGYQLLAGDQVFVVDGQERIVFTQVQSVFWDGKSVKSSDVPVRRIALTFKESLADGSHVFNIFGELVGVIDSTMDTNLVIPFEHLQSVFQEVLAGEEQISTPRLGVNTIDLSRTIGLSETLTRGLTSGALLYGSAAVERGSSAQTAGLLESDVIISVDGEMIGEAFTLDDLIARFSPEDVVILTIDRSGERMDIVATLGSSLK